MVYVSGAILACVLFYFFFFYSLKSREGQDLIEEMVATMRHKIGMGLAAPQIAISKQVLISPQVHYMLL